MYNRIGKKMAYKSIVKMLIYQRVSPSPQNAPVFPPAHSSQGISQKLDKKSFSFSVIFPDC
jgi:hypothetical protein